MVDRVIGFQVGGVAQLGEHLLCKQGVTGSIPVVSTRRAIFAGERAPETGCRRTGDLRSSAIERQYRGNQEFGVTGCWERSVPGGWFCRLRS